MVANVGKLKGKMAENGYNNGAFAEAMGMSAITLKRKINDEHYEFTIGESIRAKDLLHLSTREYLGIFIDADLN
jgi:hypothetical protein